MKPYAELGLFLDVTDFQAKQGNIIRAATEANAIDGRQYGIPYSFSLNTIVTSSSMATDRENWTKDYCMQKTEESNTAIFIGAPYGWTREESLPFFYGEKTAAEVAKIVDSRVQLYLDERK